MTGTNLHAIPSELLLPQKLGLSLSVSLSVVVEDVQSTVSHCFTHPPIPGWEKCVKLQAQLLMSVDASDQCTHIFPGKIPLLSGRKCDCHIFFPVVFFLRQLLLLSH